MRMARTSPNGPSPERRTRLTEALTLSDRLRLTTALEVATPPALDTMFEQAVADGSEGLVCKSARTRSTRRAPADGSGSSSSATTAELADTIDLVVVGAYAGRGRRRGTYGAVLLAAYDPETELYQTVGKCGTGFSDAELAALPAMLEPLARAQRPARVDSRVPADVWFEPSLVLEVLSAELTLSPNHTAGWGSLKMTLGCRYGSPGSPAVGAMTRSRRTRPPINSLSSSTALHGGRRPAEVSAGRHFSACVRYGSHRPHPSNACPREADVGDSHHAVVLVGEDVAVEHGGSDEAGEVHPDPDLAARRQGHHPVRLEPRRAGR